MSGNSDPTPEPVLAEPVPAAPAGATRGWVKVLLALSLAANLGIAGLVAGVWMRHGGPPRSEARDMGLGPLGDAMTREDRKALRDAFVARAPEMKGGKATLRAEYGSLSAALRAQPFDRAALETALASIAAQNADRLQAGREVIAAYLVAMSDADRAAFADRLEAALEKGRKSQRSGD